MDEPQHPAPGLPGELAELAAAARALGSERRLAVLDALIASPTPLRVADLVDRLGYHHLAVREHLAALRDAGLVVEERLPSGGRGRPPLTYRPAPGALDRWTAAGPHAELAGMLLDVLGGRSPYEVGVGHGERISRGATATDPVERLVAVTSRHGFAPDRIDHDGGRVEVALCRCPFVALAEAAPGVVCELHRGILDGILATADLPRPAVGLILGAPPAEPCRVVLTGARRSGPGPRRPADPGGSR